jgi:hypothetical protein
MSYTTHVSDFVCTNGFTQSVDQPAREDNMLDYVFCSDALCCDNISYLAPLANSDHCIVSFSLALSLPESDAVHYGSSRPNFAKANWFDLCGYLNSVHWVIELGNCVSASSMWDKFFDIVMVGVLMYVPFYKTDGPQRGRIHYPLRIKKLL